MNKVLDWRGLLKRALLDGSDFAPVEAAVAHGSARLWLGERSAAVTQTVKVLELPLAAGNLTELKTMLAAAEAEARAEGCARVLCAGRRGWARALKGYRPMTLLVKEL
jgi:hypothetical protein